MAANSSKTRPIIMGVTVPVVIVIFLVVTLSLAQQPPEQTTTTASPSSAAQQQTTTVSPSGSESTTTEAPKDGDKDKKSEDDQQPKVFIIHHHYGDPQDLEELARRLQPVDGQQGAGGDLPPEYSDPNFPFAKQQPPAVGSDGQPTTPAPEDAGRFDPLGQFTDGQKKRQFFQDLLMNQLNKFEAEFEPMIEKEDNMTQKNDMEEVLGAVKDLKRTIENHQIFNITELMDDWKEGRLKPETTDKQKDGDQPTTPNGPPMPKVHHHYHFRPRNLQQQQGGAPNQSPFSMPPPPSMPGQAFQSGPSQSELVLHRPPPMTRTYFLMPQSRLVQPQFVPHFHPHSVPQTFGTSQIQPFRTSQSDRFGMNNGGGFQSPMMAYYRRRMELSSNTPMSNNFNQYNSPYQQRQDSSMWARSVDGEMSTTSPAMVTPQMLNALAAAMAQSIPNTEMASTEDSTNNNNNNTGPSSNENNESTDETANEDEETSSTEDNVEFQK